MKACSILRVLLLLSAVPAVISAQIGGPFAITQSVIAAGGERSTGGSFALDSTSGQPIAGNAVSSTPFTIISGFWNFTPLAPTAAAVSITGRVKAANGAGIRNVVVTLMSPKGSTNIARSSSFGYYRFDEVPSCETYIVSVVSKRFIFAQASITIGVFDEITGLDFIADPLP